ncbi:mannan-binding lectin serine protease 1-like isoform X2 [Patiria miniata]|uniref:Uncharacterized protein n=1 Tax=Patiria miniata TaxID=46514 RepID=A0A914AEM0_PATMI|nr:mannan-binding lectin serine protease 1-like isoform X2 [Patiria miniata]XP_038062029.1 mannan-binding lectin serine protease 1-like isoform X2 [Patiria miniata]
MTAAMGLARTWWLAVVLVFLACTCVTNVAFSIDGWPSLAALNMGSEQASGVKPIATDVSDGSVTLDWSDWYREIDGESLFLVRFIIKYRIADNDATMQYEIAAEPRNYETRHTVTGLKERTRYEFIVEGVRLGLEGEEVGPTTQPLVVITPCGAPSQVSNAVVWPQNGTGKVLKLSWGRPDDPDCSPSSYIVEFRQLSLGQCEREAQVLDSTSLAGSTELTQFTIGGLQPHSTYTVYVTSRNRYGISQAWRHNVTTNEEVPSAAPTGLQSKYVDGTKLRVSWDPVPCGHRGGIITGYTYILLDVTTDQVSYSDHTSDTNVVLPESRALRRYKFLVAANTAVGRGPYAAFSVDAQPKILDICGRPAPYDASRDIVQKISTGTDARKGSAPWLAQLWYVDKGTLFCHGSILDNRWILTAAHCIRARNATKNDIMIRLGDHDKSLPEMEEQVYRVEDIKVHRSFSTKLFDADVALVKLTQAIQFTDYVKPICLPVKPLSKSMLRPGTYGTVSGWGKVSSHDENYPRHLKRVTLPVQDQVVCRRSTHFEVTPNMFCAGYSAANRGDSCEGDSGAPFAVQHMNTDRWYILGVVSWGEGCDRKDKYGFYVRLHRYTAWIRKQTGIKLS